MVHLPVRAIMGDLFIIASLIDWGAIVATVALGAAVAAFLDGGSS